MTVIYIDTLFLLNALVDYLLLLAAARLAGERLRRVRFALGAALGGLYAVAIFLPGLEFLREIPCRLSAAALMLLAAYGGSVRLLRQAVIFFALACAFGGGVAAISMAGGRGLSLGRGVFYSALDLKTVLLSAAVCYVLLTLALQRVGRHTAASGELLPVRLELGGRSVSLTALADTGNTLTDPVSGAPVMVAEGAAVLSLFPENCRPGPDDLRDPAGSLERLGVGKETAPKFRLLPYRAVGVERGLLLAARVDRVTLGGRDCGRQLVALSPTPVSDGGAYRALVGSLDGKEEVR